MAAKLTILTHKIAIQLHVVAESCTICCSRSRRPVQKLSDTPSYVVTFVQCVLCTKNSIKMCYKTKDSLVNHIMNLKWLKCMLVILCGFMSPPHGAFSGCGWRKRHPDMELLASREGPRNASALYQVLSKLLKDAKDTRKEQLGPSVKWT
jgi:hypothetical protein